MKLFKRLIRKKESTIPEIDLEKLPKHIGIIMDGNGRWAKERRLPRSLGHKTGASTLKKIIKFSNKLGIKYMTVYAFSTENWKRPEGEVNALMKLLEQYLDESIRDCHEDTVRFKIIGDLSALSLNLRRKIEHLEKITNDKKGITLHIALNYGGRNEIIHGIKKMCYDLKENNKSIDDITEELFSKYLYISEVQDVDLIIRPSGEYRLSNFLIWQSAYSEFYFDDVLWPDYKEEDLVRAILEFQNRNRRFGGL